MRKNEFETRLTVGIAYYRLSLLRESGNRNLFYSNLMYDSENENKVYLLELGEEHFTLRSDFIFDEATQHFFYVSKDKFEFSEENLKEALIVLRDVERKVYDILSKLKLKGFYTKGEFIVHLLERIPQLELIENTVRDRKSGKAFITIKIDVLYFVYKDGKTESYMNITKKDLNENILNQCVELITAALKYQYQGN
jgi:hypothetical protein